MKTGGSMGGSSGDEEEDTALSVDADLTESPPVLRVRGELDIATAPDLESAGLNLDGDPDTIVLDLSDLTFLDSSGLTAIVRLHRRLSGRGGRVILRRARPFVRDILRVAGLDRVIDIEQ